MLAQAVLLTLAARPCEQNSDHSSDPAEPARDRQPAPGSKHNQHVAAPAFWLGLEFFSHLFQ